MEIDDRRTPDTELGRRVGAGRDGVIHAAAGGRVLRWVAAGRDVRREAAAMELARSAGYPVPQVFRVGDGELELARVEGPTMVDDLTRRPWRAASHGRALAALHRRLHEIEVPAALGLDAPFGAGKALLHLDLHPANVILSPTGPVVIDWTNAAMGDGAADEADTWVVLAGATPDVPSWVRPFIAVVRRGLCRAYLGGIDRVATRRYLAAAADRRARDPNIGPAEIRLMHRFVERETGQRRTPAS